MASRIEARANPELPVWAREVAGFLLVSLPIASRCRLIDLRPGTMK
jgi:hypothetical protein